MRKTFGRFFLLAVILLSVFCGLTFESLNLQYTNSVIIFQDDYNNLVPYPPLSLNISNKDNKNNEITLNYKLFNLFRIKNVKGTFVKEDEVILGGQPIGVSIGVEGLIISGIRNIVTDAGVVSPLEHTNIKSGDILVSIDDYKVFAPSDIEKAIKLTNNKTVKLRIKRENEFFDEKITLAFDALSHEYKLGLSIKDNITGVGTLTYIKQNGRYGALGHHIIDGDLKSSANLNVGSVYNCSIIGVVKGKKGTAGELRGIFNKYDTGIGTIDKNNNFGIFGNINKMPEKINKIKIGSEQNIKHGKAYIYTTINGYEPDYYEIDIIKTVPQHEAEEKSMVISITDKRLIESTGGIVQGMSGSPIIQNGYLIGAVTHVFINDPTKGYGVYINWMLDNNN